MLHRLATLVLLLLTLTGWIHAQVIEIPDPKLRAIVREALNLPADVPLTGQTMRRLPHLDAPRDSQITNLSGLEYATNLSYLALGGNEVTDLTPIAGLTKLRLLSLWGSPITDLSPLAALTGLTDLYLGYCGTMSDIAPIANLTNLTFLQLSGNRIVDISPLEHLTNLRELQLQDNRVIDVSPVDSLPLTRFTYDQSCEIPGEPVLPRIQDRDFPSVFAAWSWSSPVLNRPDLSQPDQISLHDLYVGARFGMNVRQTNQGVKVIGYLERAQQERDAFLALNPNMVFLISVHVRDAYHGDDPDDSPYSPYWVRDRTAHLFPVGKERIW